MYTVAELLRMHSLNFCYSASGWLHLMFSKQLLDSAEAARLVECWTKEYRAAGLLRKHSLNLSCSASGWLHSNVQQAATRTWLSRSSALSLTHTAPSHLAQVSFHQLSKGLLSCCYDDLLPPTQQGFAEPLLLWLSKALLSLTLPLICTQRGDSE